MNIIEISQTIRRVRQTQGLTVDQLAQKCGLSKGFISQLENFRQVPTVRTLAKIADALGMPVSAMFEENETYAPQYTFGNLTSGEPMNRDNGEHYGIHYNALAYKQIGRIMDPFLVEYTHGEIREYKSHDTDEFFVLLEGKLDYFLYDDGNCHHMQAGDTLYMKANIPHKVHLSEGCNYAKGLIIYTSPAIKAE